MEEINILNLYACLGGNRYKWDEVAKELGIILNVTAVELDPELARMYQERFPNDNVIIGDAHAYLLHNYKEFDFIWSSPPCPKNSRARYWSAKGNDSVSDEYPDLTLYQQHILLEHWYAGKYCIENVIPYYEPLIPAKKKGRHLYWTNFNLPNVLSERVINIGAGEDEVKKLCEFHDIDLSTYKGNQRKDKIARNLVDYEAGRTILETALGVIRKQNERQIDLFETL